MSESIRRTLTGCPEMLGTAQLGKKMLWVYEADLSNAGSSTLRLLGGQSVYLSKGRACRVGGKLRAIQTVKVNTECWSSVAV